MVKKPEELVKITFEKISPAELRWELGVLNVHHAALFPDEDGIAQFLSNEWSDLDMEWSDLRRKWDNDCRHGSDKSGRAEV